MNYKENMSEFLVNKKNKKKEKVVQEYGIEDLKENYKIGIKYYEDVEDEIEE